MVWSQCIFVLRLLLKTLLLQFREGFRSVIHQMTYMTSSAFMWVCKRKMCIQNIHQNIPSKYNFRFPQMQTAYSSVFFYLKCAMKCTRSKVVYALMQTEAWIYLKSLVPFDIIFVIRMGKSTHCQSIFFHANNVHTTAHTGTHNARVILKQIVSARQKYAQLYNIVQHLETSAHLRFKTTEGKNIK